ncbi:MAG: recombinase family protein [Prolixibacteraceae bacterium]
MKLGVYCRISRAKDGNDLSIADQKQKGIKKASELNLQYELYIDEGKSGASDRIEDRPEFERLLGDVTNGKISAVFAYDQSRIERNPQMRFMINKTFKENNINYYTELDGQVDLFDPQSEFYGDLMSVINKYHVTMTKIKVKSALKTRVESGKAHSILPYGYKKNENGMLIVDKEESEIIKQIFDLSLSGMGTRSIADFLNETGVPTRYNKIQKGTISTKNKHTGTITTKLKKDVKWAGNTIRNIITNTIYKGERIYSGETFRVPNIISITKWESAQENLKKNRNNTGKKVDHQYLLKGLLTCGVCGRNMYGRSRVNKKDHYYMCSSKRIKGGSCGNRSINIDKIEALIWDRFFKGDEFLKRIKKEFTDDGSKLKEIDNNVKRLQKKLTSLKKEKDRAIELVIKGTISEEDVKMLISQKNAEIEKIKDNLEKDIQIKKVIENNSKLLKKYDDDFAHFSSTTTFMQKKKIANDFIENIKVKYFENLNRYEISISFKLDIEEEFYYAIGNFKAISHKGDFILPRTIQKNPFIIPKSLTINGNRQNISIYGDDDGSPFCWLNDEIFPVYNTKVPYGDVDDWTDDDVNIFYKNHPELYCKESGVSLLSKNIEDESYNIAREQNQVELAKKNESTTPLDTISSEIV